MKTILAFLTLANGEFAKITDILKAIIAQGGDLAPEAQKLLDLLGAPLTGEQLAALGSDILPEILNIAHGKFDGRTHAGDGA